MIALYATLHTLTHTLRDRLHPPADDGRERGLTTVEIALWAAAFVVLAGIVIAAFTAFVNGKLAQLT